MSAYSEFDLIAAFDCAEERANHVEDMRHMVNEHLLGDCPCDRNRCKHCRGRDRNRVQQHADGCPMKMGKR